MLDGKTYEQVPGDGEVDANALSIETASLTDNGCLVLTVQCLCGCEKLMNYVVSAEDFAFLAESIPALLKQWKESVN